jgi:hypothetical protein
MMIFDAQAAPLPGASLCYHARQCDWPISITHCPMN